ncbi:hypothetical protein TRSC58_01855 [Trypanosoma rangeli SC58]|uniref:Uncharacterized protein n=1 Tax=Trypanosoma rangeli SC58 TaxID=429131 RepID=A0A061J4Q5_TRYRA|nr:hypothetical protein TRSC58_01855 [Trypanosoma rangeli SC58]
MNPCGNETEGVGAAHDGAASVTTPTAAAAFEKPGEKDGLPTTSVQPVEGAVDALRQMQEKQKTETEARAFVRALLADKGGSYVQSVLQAEIQKVKKKESELAIIKKKVTATNKEVDELQGDIRRAIEAKVETERMCKFLQTAMKQRARLTEEAKKEMGEHRGSVKQKVEQNVHDIRVK